MLYIYIYWSYTYRTFIMQYFHVHQTSCNCWWSQCDTGECGSNELLMNAWLDGGKGGLLTISVKDPLWLATLWLRDNRRGNEIKRRQLFSYLTPRHWHNFNKYLMQPSSLILMWLSSSIQERNWSEATTLPLFGNRRLLLMGLRLIRIFFAEQFL